MVLWKESQTLASCTALNKLTNKKTCLKVFNKTQWCQPLMYGRFLRKSSLKINCVIG